MTALLELIDVNKKINNQYVLKNINLTISTPSIYGIIGRNGSGKSLLFKTISGLLVPTDGQINILGEPLTKGNFPKNFGALLDTPGFLGHYSGFKNLKLLASIQNKISAQEIKSVITSVGLDPNDKKPVRKYSLGMKQRLGIAQAIMEKPQLLILDEPMNGLDESGVIQMRALLKDFKKSGMTILLSSHHSEDIHTLCDKVYRMDAGELSELTSEGSPQ